MAEKWPGRLPGHATGLICMGYLGGRRLKPAPPIPFIQMVADGFADLHAT
jgi:hypothetical protein